MKILGIGNPFMDRTAHIDEIPVGLQKGQTIAVFEKEKVEELWQKFGPDSFNWSLGGSCTNVMTALSAIIDCFSKKSSCALLGMVGKDKKAEIEKKLKELGIESFLAEGNEPNGIVNCFVTPDFDRTMQTFVGASREFTQEHILPLHFENVSHVHLEGYLAYFKDILEFSTSIAKEKGATVSLDLSSIDVISKCSDQLKKCASKVDIIFGNLGEMKEFTGQAEIENIFGNFKKEQIVVVTHGSQGGWFKANETNQFFQFNAVAVDKPLDTTGAGDFFIAGFLAGFLDRKDIHLGIRVATFVASYVIQQDGTELSKQKWKELKENVEIIMSSENI